MPETSQARQEGAARPPLVRLSARAAQRIRHLLSRRGAEASADVLRVSVSGGGCSGFQYEFALTADTREDDVIIEREGARLAVDSLSLPFMAGSEVDYVEELAGASFQVRNPQAASVCSCGVSFVPQAPQA